MTMEAEEELLMVMYFLLALEKHPQGLLSHNTQGIREFTKVRSASQDSHIYLRKPESSSLNNTE